MSVSVLIVDDLLFMRKLIKSIVENGNMEVAGEAENGRAAIHQYLAKKPDVVLMDITMPVMDGLHALKRIKAINPTAKIIICSSLGQRRYIIEAIKLGAADFIIKPFKPERILSAVQKAVEAHES